MTSKHMNSATEELPSGRFATLALCGLAALLEGFDTQSMGVAGPRVIAEFHLAPSQAAYIFSSTTLGLFVGAALGGRLADYLGRKRALMGSLLLFGAFSLLTAATTGSTSLIAVRLLTGLGLGGAMPNFIALASENTTGRERLSIVTVIMAAMPFGGAIAALVALGAGISGWSWRSIFYVGGFAPLLLSIVMALWLRESRPGSAADNRDGVESVSSVLFRDGRRGTTLLLWTAYFFSQLVLLLMLNWLPTLILAAGFSKTQGSLAAVCFNLGGSAGSFILGRLHAGEHRRRWVAVTYSGMVAALAAVASAGSDFVVAGLACAVAGVFIVGATLILFALAPLYYPTRIRGTGVGAAVATGRLGSVVGPLFAGALLSAGGSSGTVLLSIVPFVLIGGSAAFALTFKRQSGD